MTDVTGYLLKDCGSIGAVWNYLPPHQCRTHCMGEAVPVYKTSFGDHPVSRRTARAFADWRNLTAIADQQRIAGSADDPYACADDCGLDLAVRLRCEIGPGPVIVFEKREHSRCGGPYAWKIADDLETTTYFHAPHAGYVIDPSDDCGAWAWQYSPATHYFENGVVARANRWSGEVEIPEGLVDAFSAWQQKWLRVDFDSLGEDAYADEPTRDFSWARFHDEGIRLTHLLKRFVGGNYKVIYARANEDMSSFTDFWNLELRSNGSTRPYEHRPYWLQTP